MTENKQAHRHHSHFSCGKKGCGLPIPFPNAICAKGHCNRHRTVHEPLADEPRACAACGEKHGDPVVDELTRVQKKHGDGSPIFVSVVDGFLKLENGLWRIEMICRKCRKLAAEVKTQDHPSIMHIRCCEAEAQKRNDELRRAAQRAEREKRTVQVVELFSSNKGPAKASQARDHRDKNRRPRHAHIQAPGAGVPEPMRVASPMGTPESRARAYSRRAREQELTRLGESIAQALYPTDHPQKTVRPS